MTKPKQSENCPLTEKDLCHPFESDRFLQQMFDEEDIFTYPGLPLPELLLVRNRFKEVFGFCPPVDYLAFLHFYNGFDFNGRWVCGVDVEEPHLDLFAVNEKSWIPGAAGDDAVLLGRYDDIRYLYLPEQKKYAACEFTIEDTFDTIWEMLDSMTGDW